MTLDEALDKVRTCTLKEVCWGLEVGGHGIGLLPMDRLELLAILDQPQLTDTVPTTTYRIEETPGSMWVIMCIPEEK